MVTGSEERKSGEISNLTAEFCMPWLFGEKVEAVKLSGVRVVVENVGTIKLLNELSIEDVTEVGAEESAKAEEEKGGLYELDSIEEDELEKESSMLLENGSECSDCSDSVRGSE